MRFSTISEKDKGSFISSREKSWEDHVASILDPERLQFRLRFLTEVTFPQFANQSLKPSADWFCFIVVISKLLPDTIRAPLYAAAKNYPWVRIVERGVDEWVGAGPLMKQALASMPYSGPEVPYATFRLDDDDTVSVKYLEKVQSHIDVANVDKFFTFSHGAKILWDSKKFAIRNYQDEVSPFIAIGLGAISLFNYESKDFASDIKTVYVGLNHYEIKRTHAFVDDVSPSMWIWSHHMFQDTFGRFKSREFKGEWEAAPGDITQKLADFSPLVRFLG